MKLRDKIKNLNFKEILLFILGAAFTYFLPQSLEALINKAAQYAAGMLLISFAFFYFDKSGKEIKYFLGGIIFAVTFQFLNSFSYYIEKFSDERVLLIILILSIFFIFYYLNKVNLKFKYILAGLLFSITLQSALTTYTTFKNRIENPNKWDFLCFYINGKVAIKGLNYYSPENYIKVYDELDIPIEVNEEFYRETIEVAIQYFPQSIFLFLPLGLFDFMEAHILWNYFLLLFLILDLLLIKKIFFKNAGLISFLFLIPVFLFFYAVRLSIIFDSYTFLMLFALLMMWKEKNENLIGLWIAVGIFLKPLGLIFMLYPLLRKKWKALLYSIFYTAVSLIITMIVFGSSTVFSFLTQNTIKNLPSWSYTDNVNQSLLSTILRLTDFNFYFHSPLYQPYFIILGLIFSIITFWLAYKLDSSENELSLSLITIYTLIIYPSTLNHYFLLAIPVIFFIINTIMEKKFFLMVFVLGLAYSFMIYLPFITSAVLFTYLVWYSFLQIKKSGNTSFIPNPLKYFRYNY